MYHTERKFAKTSDSKGLRHFAAKVCSKVKEKGKTNYSEVADELVKEYFDSLDHPPVSIEKQQYDMKNIRRRVYDALNVLMAIEIIKKDKKEITWIGLPASSVHEVRRLEEDKIVKLKRINEKKEQLFETMSQLVAHQNLIKRNKEYEAINGHPDDNSLIYLPYIIITTSKETTIDCEISDDKTEYRLNFDKPFELKEDVCVLKSCGLGIGTNESNLSPEVINKCKQFLPEALRPVLETFFTVSDPAMVNRTKRLPYMPISRSLPQKVSVIRGIANHSEPSSFIAKRQIYSGVNHTSNLPKYAIVPKVHVITNTNKTIANQTLIKPKRWV